MHMFIAGQPSLRLVRVAARQAELATDRSAGSASLLRQGRTSLTLRCRRPVANRVELLAAAQLHGSSTEGREEREGSGGVRLGMWDGGGTHCTAWAAWALCKPRRARHMDCVAAHSRKDGPKYRRTDSPRVAQCRHHRRRCRRQRRLGILPKRQATAAAERGLSVARRTATRRGVAHCVAH